MSAGGGTGGGATGGGSTGTGGSSSGDPYAAERQRCIDRVNELRATVGLPPYEAWPENASCADAQAMSDGQAQDAHSAFGDCPNFAQNECPGYKSLESVLTSCLDAMWGEGPGPFDDGHGHYVNMTSTEYTKMTCGFATSPDGKIWAVQDFR
jgi:uncharacterized protein YkwD